MAFQKVEFTFPDGEGEGEEEETTIEIEPSGEVTLGEEIPAEVEPVEPVEAKPEPESGELEIEIVDDTPPDDQNRKKSAAPEDVTEEELKAYSEKVRKRIQKFSKSYHDERREKETAQRERAELQQYAQRLIDENTKLKGNVGKSNRTLYEQAKRTNANDLDRAKLDYKQAYEAGDSDAMLAAQDKLTTSQIRADKLNQIKLPPLQKAGAVVQPEVTVPVTEDLPAPQVNARAKEWFKTNTWFGSDDEMTGLALGFNSTLLKDGIDPESDEFYEKVDSRMRELFPDNFENTTVNQEQLKLSNDVVAPATRSRAPKKVRLTKTQVSVARKLGVPLELYAKEVAEVMRKNDG